MGDLKQLTCRIVGKCYSIFVSDPNKTALPALTRVTGALGHRIPNRICRATRSNPPDVMGIVRMVLGPTLTGWSATAPV